MIHCPNCKEGGVEEFHPGGRIQCRSCKAEFRLTLDPIRSNFVLPNDGFPDYAARDEMAGEFESIHKKWVNRELTAFEAYTAGTKCRQKWQERYPGGKATIAYHANLWGL